MVPKLIVGGGVYVLAAQEEEDPPVVEDTGPSSEDMVEELRSSPSENWREYLQPIIISIRNQYGLETGKVKLLGPRLKSKLSSPSYGFSIEGHVRFEDGPPDDVREKHGQAPYKFEANVNPDGELVSSIKLTGSEG